MICAFGRLIIKVLQKCADGHLHSWYTVIEVRNETGMIKSHHVHLSDIYVAPFLGPINASYIAN